METRISQFRIRAYVKVETKYLVKFLILKQQSMFIRQNMLVKRMIFSILKDVTTLENKPRFTSLIITNYGRPERRVG